MLKTLRSRLYGMIFLTVIAASLLWPKRDEIKPAPDFSPETEVLPHNASFVAHPAVSDGKSSKVRSEKTTEPAIAAFGRWMERYNSVSEKERVSLVPEGMKLASERRTVMANLIRTNPALALASAVPVMTRKQLPTEVLPLLEERVSGKGDFATLAVVRRPGQRITEPKYLAAMVNDREYRAYTFGNRAKVKNLNGVGIHGVALDGRMAVSDSPIRVLERGETANGKPVEAVCAVSGLSVEIDNDAPLNLEAPVAYDAGDRIHVACEPRHVGVVEARLLASELGNGGPGSSGVSDRPAQSWTHGAKKVLIIRVDFSDLAGAPINDFDSASISETYAVNEFNKVGGVRDFYEQNSFGKTTLSIGAAVSGDSPDVTGVLRMPATAASYATAGNNSGLHTAARNAATAAGFNLANYDRIGVVFSSLSDIPSSQITYGGLGNVNGPNFWVNGYYTVSLLAHEIGHNYGLDHSNLWKVTDGNPISPAGTSLEYGDDFDIMGDGSGLEHHFSHWNKSILQWIPDSAVTTITTGGTYRVYRFDAQGANTANPLALKVVRNSNQDYWIGHRRATTNAALDNGAYVLWGYNQVQQGELLDLATPGNSTADAALQVGASFNDASAGITLTTTTRGGSGNDEWIDVQVAFVPRIQFAASSVVVSEQAGTASIVVERMNNATGAVSVNYSTTAGSAVAPADFTSTSGTLSWANGDSAPKTITVPIISDAVAESVESFTVTLSGVSGGVIFGSAVATVNVVDPGVSDPVFVPDFVNSAIEKVVVQPDGKLVIGGWFSSLQDASFASYARSGIARMNADGTVDSAFASGGGIAGGSSDTVYDVAMQPDGKLIIGGDFATVHGVARAGIARLNEDGTLDTTFNPGTGTNDYVYAVLIQPDGRILIGGDFTTVNGVARRMLARLNADGSVDTSFTPPTFAAGAGWSVKALALQPDGKIVVGGGFYFSGSPFKSGLCRVSSSGTLDATFSGITNGAHVSGNTGSLRDVTKVIVLDDGKLLVSGAFTAFNNVARPGIAKLTSTGALDTAFAPTGNGDVNAMCLQPDGKIIIAGAFTTFNGTALNRIARLTSTGTNDTTFNTLGGSDASIEDLALQPDGRVVLAGNFGHFQGSADTSPVWRFYAGLTALPGSIQFSSASYTGIDGTSLTISATRTGGSAGVLSVGYSTVAGTSTTGSIPVAQGNFSWANGDSATKTINVPIAVSTRADIGKTFRVNLGEPLIGAAILGAVQQSTVNIESAFTAWQKSNFTGLELADSGISGDLADPDGDGLNNLTEFALGFPPKTASVSGMATGITNISGSNYLTLTFRRRTPALDLAYTVQNSGALGTTWTSTTTLVGSPTNNGDGTETVTFRDNTPISLATQRFLRLQIVRTP